jgi:hypothetical protein
MCIALACYFLIIPSKKTHQNRALWLQTIIFRELYKLYFIVSFNNLYGIKNNVFSPEKNKLYNFLYWISLSILCPMMFLYTKYFLITTIHQLKIEKIIRKKIIKFLCHDLTDKSLILKEIKYQRKSNYSIKHLLYWWKNPIKYFSINRRMSYIKRSLILLLLCYFNL